MKNPLFVRGMRVGMGVGLIAFAASSLLAQPTDNPVTAMFPQSTSTAEAVFGEPGDPFYVVNTYGDYSWSDELQWSNVTVTSADGTDAPSSAPNATRDDIISSGADDTAVVQSELDTLAANGGGVLYFPAGTYYFSGSIDLYDGVVIRGATPSGVTDARDPAYDPPTNFIFPRLPGISVKPDVPENDQYLDPTGLDYSDTEAKIHTPKKIRINQPDGLTASNYGIVNVDVNRAAIEFLKKTRADGTMDRYSTLFGTDDKNRYQNKNIVVLGVRMNNAVDLEWNAPSGSMNSWQIWPNRVGPHIDVMVEENAFVGNNRINDNHWQVLVNGQSQNNYPIDDFGMPTIGPDYPDNTDRYLDKNGNVTDEGMSGDLESNNKYVIFRYSQGIGILVNRSSRVGFADSGPSNPAGEPALYSRGITVRQNWVYVSNRVGYQVSGNGLDMRDNVREDRSGETVFLKQEGTAFQTNNSATYENRGYDLSGVNILFENNTWNVQRRSIRGDYPTIDGEGVLVQPNDAGIMYNQMLRNNSGNSYMSIYKVQYNRNIAFLNNTVTGGVISLLGDPNFFPGIFRHEIRVENNDVSGSITFDSGLIAEDTEVTIANNTTGNPIDLADYGATINNQIYKDVSGNSAGVEYNSWVGTTTSSFPSENVLNPAPIVEILSPQPDQELIAGQPITVEVEVTWSDVNGSNSLDSVTLYDGSQLDPNQKVFDRTHLTDPNVQAGATELTDPDGDGIYTASWTPTQAYIDYGLFVVEALMTEQTVKDGFKDSPPVDRSYRDHTFAILGDYGLPGDVPTTAERLENLVMQVTAGDDFQMTFDTEVGKTYQLQKSSDLSSWTDVSGALVTGDGNSGTLEDSGGMSGQSKMFYRVDVQ